MENKQLTLEDISARDTKQVSKGTAKSGGMSLEELSKRDMSQAKQGILRDSSNISAKKTAQTYYDDITDTTYGFDQSTPLYDAVKHVEDKYHERETFSIDAEGAKFAINEFTKNIQNNVTNNFADLTGTMSSTAVTAFGKLWSAPLTGLTALTVEAPMGDFGDPNIPVKKTLQKSLDVFLDGYVDQETYSPDRMTESLINSGMNPISAASLSTLGQLGYYLAAPAAFRAIVKSGKLNLLNKIVKNINKAIKTNVKIPKAQAEMFVQDRSLTQFIKAYYKSRGLNIRNIGVEFQPKSPTGFNNLIPFKKGVTIPSPSEVDAGLIKQVSLRQPKIIDPIKSLKSNIMASATGKGMSKAELNRIIKKRTGKGSLSVKKLTEADLKDVLSSVKRTRPKTISGKTVIRPKTEKQIQTLKENLINRKELTQELFNKVLDFYKVKTPKYIDNKNFITESTGKKILRAMRDMRVYAKTMTELSEAMKDNPNIKSVVDSMLKDLKNQYGDNPLKVSQVVDAMHAWNSIEAQTGTEVGYMFEKTLESKQNMEWEFSQDVLKLMDSIGKKEYLKIFQDESAQKRVAQYIESKNPEYNVEYPKNITKSEKILGKGVEDLLKKEQVYVRYDRLIKWIDKKTEIPSASNAELTKAKDILQTEGYDAVIEHLKDVSWGTIAEGYLPRELTKPTVRLGSFRAGISEKGTETRILDEAISEQRNVLDRVLTYYKSRLTTRMVKPYVNSLSSLMRPILEGDVGRGVQDARKLASGVGSNLERILGIRPIPKGLAKVVRNLYSQAATTIFATDPKKGVRNLIQNPAYYTRIDEFWGLTKKITGKEALYYAKHVSQKGAIADDFLYSKEGFKFFSILNNLARRVDVIGTTDNINRYLPFRMRTNKAKNALSKHSDWKGNKESLIKLIKSSGIEDYTVMEQVHALRKLAVDGVDEFVNYTGLGQVRRIHYLYERSQKGFIEQQDALSEILSNLLTFPKGYIQRLAFNLGKFKPSRKGPAGSGFKVRGALELAWQSFIGLYVADKMYEAITGDDSEPYNALKMFSKAFPSGGLALGALDAVIKPVSFTISAVAEKDKELKKFYISEAIKGYSKLPNMFIPFYEVGLNVFEGMTNKKDYDAMLLQDMVRKINKSYKGIKSRQFKEYRAGVQKFYKTVFGSDINK